MILHIVRFIVCSSASSSAILGLIHTNSCICILCRSVYRFHLNFPMLPTRTFAPTPKFRQSVEAERENKFEPFFIVPLEKSEQEREKKRYSLIAHTHTAVYLLAARCPPSAGLKRIALEITCTCSRTTMLPVEIHIWFPIRSAIRFYIWFQFCDFKF